MTFTKKETRRALTIAAFSGLAVLTAGLTVAAFASVLVGVGLVAVGGLVTITSAGCLRIGSANIRIKEYDNALNVDLPSSTHGSVIIKNFKNKSRSVKKKATHYIDKQHDKSQADQSILGGFGSFIGSLFSCCVRSSAPADAERSRIYYKGR